MPRSRDSFAYTKQHPVGTCIIGTLTWLVSDRVNDIGNKICCLGYKKMRNDRLQLCWLFHLVFLSIYIRYGEKVCNKFVISLTGIFEEEASDMSVFIFE